MKRLASILFVFALISISVVYAVWNYENIAYVSTVIEPFAPSITDFYYPENLPTDTEGELYHGGVLEKIVSADEGLNAPGSLLIDAIETRKKEYKDSVSSSQQVKGGNLKNIFSTIEGFENVGFVIHFDSDTQYSIYTYNNKETNTEDVYIETYKTYALLKEGTWVLAGGYKGEAIVINYDGNTSGPYKNAIDPDTWRPTN